MTTSHSVLQYPKRECSSKTALIKNLELRFLPYVFLN